MSLISCDQCQCYDGKNTTYVFVSRPSVPCAFRRATARTSRAAAQPDIINVVVVVIVAVRIRRPCARRGRSEARNL